MVCGRSGMGKSELMNVLLLSAKEPKIVFSFKPNDAYLRMPCQVIDISKHIPDPFQDADAFSIAYALDLPSEREGYHLLSGKGDSQERRSCKQELERVQGQPSAHGEEDH